MNDHDDATLIKEYQNWPLRCLLPVKKRQDNFGPRNRPDCGIIVAKDVAEGNIKVYLTNMWSLKEGLLQPQLKDVETLEFENIEALLAAGWVVD